MSSKRMTWALKGACLYDISLREKRTILDDGETEYAVLKVSVIDNFDGFHLRETKTKQGTLATIMCFRRDLWERVETGQIYDWSGFVKLVYGGTYFVVNKIWNELGFSILTERGNHKVVDLFPGTTFYEEDTVKIPHATPTRLPMIVQARKDYLARKKEG